MNDTWVGTSNRKIAKIFGLVFLAILLLALILLAEFLSSLGSDSIHYGYFAFAVTAVPAALLVIGSMLWIIHTSPPVTLTIDNYSINFSQGKTQLDLAFTDIAWASYAPAL